jgi:hypothetical protein
MIEFTTSQLSWLIVGATSIGGTGYLSMNNKVENLNSKVVAVTVHLENQEKAMDRIQKQLERIEEKLPPRK